MNSSVTRLCSICARGGSKGLPGKNIRQLLGKPLISHSVLQAKKSGLFAKVAVSSDSPEILQAAEEAGADVLINRPESLANDKAEKLPAIQHCARKTEEQTGLAFETFVDLDATSPLRLIKDIEGAVELLESEQLMNVMTGSPSHSSPYFSLVELTEQGTIVLSKPSPVKVVRRQDTPRCYDINAAVYVWSREGLLESDTLFNHNTKLYEMPPERSHDIDSELDFEIVEFLAKKRGGLL